MLRAPGTNQEERKLNFRFQIKLRIKQWHSTGLRVDEREILTL